MKANRSLAALTLLSFVVSSCGGRKGTNAPGSALGGASPLSDQVLVQSKDLPEGLDMRVSSGRQGPPAFDRAKLAPAKKLPDAEAQRQQDIQLAARHVDTLSKFLMRPQYADEADRLGIASRLERARRRLDAARDPAYPATLAGTLGRQPRFTLE